MKSNFADKSDLINLAAGIAHDIQSPIAVLDIGLHMIERNQIDTKLLRSALQRLREISNRMLSEYRRENGCDLIALHPVLEQIVALKRYEYINKNCEIVLQFDQSIDEIKIHASSFKLESILSNLINNAFEASNFNAAIKICVQQHKDYVCISVVDNGVGISADKLDDYLNGESTKHSGRGLGLSDAKQYMETVGGKILVRSQPGEGTVVTLEFGGVVSTL